MAMESTQHDVALVNGVVAGKGHANGDAEDGREGAALADKLQKELQVGLEEDLKVVEEAVRVEVDAGRTAGGILTSGVREETGDRDKGVAESGENMAPLEQGSGQSDMVDEKRKKKKKKKLDKKDNKVDKREKKRSRIGKGSRVHEEEKRKGRSGRGSRLGEEKEDMLPLQHPLRGDDQRHTRAASGDYRSLGARGRENGGRERGPLRAEKTSDGTTLRCNSLEANEVLEDLRKGYKPGMLGASVDLEQTEGFGGDGDIDRAVDADEMKREKVGEKAVEASGKDNLKVRSGESLQLKKRKRDSNRLSTRRITEKDIESLDVAQVREALAIAEREVQLLRARLHFLAKSEEKKEELAHSGFGFAKSPDDRERTDSVGSSQGKALDMDEEERDDQFTVAKKKSDKQTLGQRLRKSLTNIRQFGRTEESKPRTKGAALSAVPGRMTQSPSTSPRPFSAAGMSSSFLSPDEPSDQSDTESEGQPLGDSADSEPSRPTEAEEEAWEKKGEALAGTRRRAASLESSGMDVKAPKPKTMASFDKRQNMDIVPVPPQLPVEDVPDVVDVEEGLNLASPRFRSADGSSHIYFQDGAFLVRQIGGGFGRKSLMRTNSTPRQISARGSMSQPSSTFLSPRVGEVPYLGALVQRLQDFWIEVGSSRDLPVPDQMQEFSSSIASCSSDDIKYTDVTEFESHTLTVPVGSWYEVFFVGRDHTNYVAQDSSIGPVILSLMRDKNEEGGQYYRAVLRSPQDTVGFLGPTATLKPTGGLFSKSVLKPLLQRFDPTLSHRTFEKCDDESLISSLVSFQKLEVESIALPRQMKVGVCNWRPDNHTEEDMLSNNEPSDAFRRMLDILGEQVVLKDFPKYAGGLDISNNGTGEHSVYTSFFHEQLKTEIEVMFHVAPLLPFTKNNNQQVERKRHIGNDVTVIVFMDDWTSPFPPNAITSKFNHIFLVVTPIVDTLYNERDLPPPHYRVCVCAKESVPPFDPPLPPHGIFHDPKALRKFLLNKMVQAEHAAVLAPAFAQRIARTRAQMLRSVVQSTV